MKKRLLIGVIITECSVDFQDEILRGIISQAFKAKCDIAVLAPHHNFYENTPHKQLSKKIFELIKSNRFDGFLYDRNTFYSEDILTYIDDLLVQSGKPVMLLDSEHHKFFECTAIDDRSAFEEITDHLVNVHGCRNIYCLTGPKKFFVSEERLCGFKSAMKKHDLPIGKNSCIYGDFWKTAAQELAGKIISGEIARPDAVVCGNDVSAMTLAESLRRGGIRVPEDIRITGYDNIAESREAGIATYRRPNFQLGAESFRRLYRIITGRICAKVPNESGCFRPNKSCGCEAVDTTKRAVKRRRKIESMHESYIFHHDMLFDIANTSSPEEFADRLDNYTYYIYKLRNVHICLTRKYIESTKSSVSPRLTFDSGDDMKVILSKSSTTRSWLPDEYFSSEDILPAFSEQRNFPSAYYISPLNFNDNFFGYSALSFGKYPMSFSDLYCYWISCINIALEQMRIRSILQHTVNTAGHAMMYDELTGMLNRSGVRKTFGDSLGALEKHGDTADFIRIQLTGLKERRFSDDEEKCLAVTSAFADILRRHVRDDEIAGLWSTFSFAVITTHPNRAEELFNALSAASSASRFSENDCCISFTVGVHSQALTAGLSADTALHKASMNRVYSCTAEDNAEDPRYEQLCRLRSRLMKEPERAWNISEIASELYLSKSYLQKMYKAYFGRSIIEEMIQFRIDKAKELLTTTDMTVTEISRVCGYSSYNYFVRQFKSAENIAPSEFRTKGN